MEHATPAHSRAYYATRATVRQLVYGTIVILFFALPGAVEQLTAAMGL